MSSKNALLTLVASLLWSLRIDLELPRTVLVEEAGRSTKGRTIGDLKGYGRLQHWLLGEVRS
jgi:hypothetical protein